MAVAYHVLNLRNLSSPCILTPKDELENAIDVKKLHSVILIASILLGGILLSAAPVAVSAYTSTFQCSLSASGNCGQSHTNVLTLTPTVTSTSPVAYICAGYNVGGSVNCTDVYSSGTGLTYTGSQPNTVSSYYRNDNSGSTTGSFSDFWCNCYAPESCPSP
jgi:hypothetical protein